MANEEATKVNEKTADKTVENKVAEEAAKAIEQEANGAKMEELEAENARLKSERTQFQSQTKPAPSSYSVSSFSEQEWSDAEAQTGLDRKAILFNLNQRLQLEGSLKKEMNDSVETLRTRVVMREEKDAMAADDPLYPKYRKEVDKFLADVPTDMLKTEENRKKWIGKAFAYAKSTVKISNTSRTAENMDTRDTTEKSKEKGAEDYSVEDKEILASHGVTVEEYRKLAHPVLKDGIMIKDRPEKPKFGPK